MPLRFLRRKEEEETRRGLSGLTTCPLFSFSFFSLGNIREEGEGEGKYRVSESECLFLSLSVLVKAALLSPPLECGRRGFEVGREGEKQGFLCLVEIRRDKRNPWKKTVQRCFPGDRKDRRSVRGRSLWLGYTVIHPASAIPCFTWSL